MYCGTSNIVLPVPNKSFFPAAYREKTRLQYYASLFNSVEVNQTFYKLPRAQTFARWAAEVPAGFRFSVKLWKGITHVKGLHFEPEDVVQFMQTVSALGNRRGSLLIQLPAGTKADTFDKLATLLEIVSRHNDGWHLALEFRQVSWYTRKLYHLLEKHQAALVVHDMPNSATPTALPDADTCYYRFHRVAGDYRGDYNSEYLAGYALRIRQAEATGKIVYAYFNNTLGNAVHNALELQEIASSTYHKK